MECGKTIEITVDRDDTYEGGHDFDEFTVPDEDSDGAYEKTGELEGDDVVAWTGETIHLRSGSATTVLALGRPISRRRSCRPLDASRWCRPTKSGQHGLPYSRDETRRYGASNAVCR